MMMEEKKVNEQIDKTMNEIFHVDEIMNKMIKEKLETYESIIEPNDSKKKKTKKVEE